MLKNLVLVLTIIMSSTCLADDILDVAWTIYMEARGESRSGKLAVASVIHNRANSQNKTCGQIVRNKPYQFSCWFNGKPELYFNETFEQCLYISKVLHRGTFQPLDDWNHFFNPQLCNPSWGVAMVNKCLIGNHLFGTI